MVLLSLNLRVVIAEDELLNRQHLRSFLEKEPGVTVVGECGDGLSAIALIRKTSPDLVFLDVRMPELDGFAVLEQLRDTIPPAVIFVTAYDQFALQAFEVNAVDYLLKPFDHKRFKNALHRARLRLTQAWDSSANPASPGNSQTPRFGPTRLTRIAVKSNGRLSIVKIADLDWISSSDNYAELHVGNTCHLLRTTLNNLTALLPADQFVRISRSHLVNLGRIKEIHTRSHGDYSVVLSTGHSLPGTRLYRQAVATFLGKGHV